MTVEIINYNSRYRRQFREINLEWLDRYNLTESHDLEVLDDPQKTVLDPGGFIFLAVQNGDIVGSAALIPTTEGEFELAKMCVRPEWQGRGVSKLLLNKCIEQAQQVHARRIILYSNSKLQRAISLYERSGFKHVPVNDAPFTTADVKMEMEL
ncbi:MAG TPA: GNAT family N-acetyltransferase [Flavitalea sp.]|nr:GNAT family N-acetyltransferase [Flavitalea sp.]